MSQAFRYKAFLSYSHSDQKEAIWLHKALERYRLPPHIVDSERPGQTLGSIFRDRDELPAAEDLTAEVKKALHTSEYMIVLCSPRAAASRWVNKEVIEFKKLRGEAAVLPIILEGEPNASDDGNPALECFPPGVRFRLGAGGSLSRKPAEPVAADMRKLGDGKQRALMKIIAGLLGVGLDQLIEREMHRKQRRVIAVTVLSMLATVVMSTLTYQAVTARQEADRNRAHAEDLVEFMLTDLKEKLEPVGRLDVLDAVGSKAVAYYEKQPLEAMTDASLGKRSRAFHILGQVQTTRGNMDAAQSMFDQAADATGSMLARDPSNTDRIFEHSQSVFWSAFQDWERGHYQGAKAGFEEYKRMATQLVAADATNMAWQKELAYANGNIGALLFEHLNQPQEAIAYFERAKDGHAAAAVAKPDDLGLKSELADIYAWIADASRYYAPLSQAIENRRLQQEMLREILAKNPRRTDAQIGLMISLMGSARAELLLANHDHVSKDMREAYGIGEALVERDPTNMWWLARYGDLLYLDVSLALSAEDVPRAERLIAQAASVVEPITSSATPTMGQKVALIYQPAAMRARLALIKGGASLRPALALLDQTISRLEGEREAILSTRGGNTQFMALYSAKGKILAALGQHVQARDTVRAAFQQLDLDYSTANPEQLLLCREMAVDMGDEKLTEMLGRRLVERGLQRGKT